MNKNLCGNITAKVAVAKHKDLAIQRAKEAYLKQKSRNNGGTWGIKTIGFFIA